MNIFKPGDIVDLAQHEHLTFIILGPGLGDPEYGSSYWGRVADKSGHTPPDSTLQELYETELLPGPIQAARAAKGTDDATRSDWTGKYRDLVNGDTMREGDEVVDDCKPGEWRKISRIMIGHKVVNAHKNPGAFRRPIVDPEEPHYNLCRVYWGSEEYKELAGEFGYDVANFVEDQHNTAAKTLQATGKTRTQLRDEGIAHGGSSRVGKTTNACPCFVEGEDGLCTNCKLPGEKCSAAIGNFPVSCGCDDRCDDSCGCDCHA